MDVYRRYIITYCIQLVYLCVYVYIYTYPTSVVFVGVYIPTNITFRGTDVCVALGDSQLHHSAAELSETRRSRGKIHSQSDNFGRK